MTLQAMARRIEHWLIEKLIPYARNPRTHSDAQIAQIAASIAEFGFNNPILVDTKSGIIAGHGRLLAARKLQLKEVPVIVLDHLTETQKRAYILADNQLALNAGWDESLLRVEIASLQEEDFNLNVIGFEDEELAQLLAAQDAAEGLTDEDAVPELSETPISAVGDLWILGNHKLLVGDATNGADVARLMAGDAADLIFTDPPYNVDYEGYTEERLKIKGDRMSDAEFKQFLEAAFRSCRTAVKPGASLYVCHSSSWQREFQNTLESAGFEVRCQIIWAKNTFAWGFGRYKFQHEPLFYAHVAGQKDPWYGDKSQSTLWQENKPAANRIHPTAKPVELIERALLNSSSLVRENCG
jgi:16S rRNA G966 N2-methylase RsmD